MLSTQDKSLIVKEVAQIAAQASAAVAVDYHGVVAKQMTEIRRQARAQRVHIKVVKNTLARRALADTPFACMSEHLKGPIMFAFAHDDPTAAARIIHDFSKDINAIEVKFIALDGRLHDATELKRLAELPTYDQAVALLMAVMIAPLEKLVRTIHAPVAQVVYAVDAVRRTQTTQV